MQVEDEDKINVVETAREEKRTMLFRLSPDYLWSNFMYNVAKCFSKKQNNKAQYKSKNNGKNKNKRL